jgi:hypothetical protein
LFNALGSRDRQTINRDSTALWWLMRAWGEHEIISKFIALFTPLEMVLEGFGGSFGPDTRIEKLRQMINSHANDDRDQLLNLVNHLATLLKPGLGTRFRELAEKAQMPGWVQDVEAFKRFNGIRNALLHRGQPDVQVMVPVSNDEIRQLQDLVERYVCYRLFNDSAVYPSSSRWIKLPGKANPGA